MSVSRLPLNLKRRGCGVQETLDYLVCSSPELQPTALLELPDLRDMIGDEAGAGLPNARWPSDHIALMAEFQFEFTSREGSGAS
jgi:mRNA deadenylase 3'-5' endonuclease subunit Ccr4